MVLRQIIVEEAIRLGFWQKLEAAKRDMRKRENAFKHLASMAGIAKAEKAAGPGGPEARKEQNVAAGKKAAEV